VSIQGVEESALEEGLSEIEAEFYTEHFVVRGSVTSPEMRLSDHLNSSTTTLELRPSQVQRSENGPRIHVEGSSAYITKSHLLFVLALHEPAPIRGSDNASWTRTVTQTCWGGLGRYSLVGKVHMEAGRNPRLFMRSLEQRQFLPFTDVRLTFPDGAVREFPTVVVNRFRLELLAIENPSG
jgi:hypothetical protein